MTRRAFPTRMAKKGSKPPIGTKGAAEWYWKRYTELYPKYFWSDETKLADIVVASAKGSLLFDVEGKEYIDLTSQWATNNLGNVHPEVLKATQDALERYGFLILFMNPHLPMIDIAEKLLEIRPSKNLTRVFLELSGTGAAEGAVKHAIEASGRPLILSFMGQYHGLSIGATAFGTLASRMRRNWEAFSGGPVHAAYPMTDRKPEGMTDDQFGEWCLGFLEGPILREVAHPGRIAGAILEPVALEAGGRHPPVDLGGGHGHDRYHATRADSEARGPGWRKGPEAREGVGRPLDRRRDARPRPGDWRRDREQQRDEGPRQRHRARGLLRLRPRRRHPAVRLRDERPPHPAAPDDRGTVAGQGPRRDGVGAAQALPLSEGPLRAHPFLHIDSKRPQEGEERFWVEVLRRELALLADRAAREEERPRGRARPREVGRRGGSESLRRLPVPEHRIDRVHDAVSVLLAGHLDQDRRVAIDVPGEVRRFRQGAEQGASRVRPSGRPRFEEAQVAEQLQRLDRGRVEGELEVDIADAFPNEPRKGVDLLVVHGVHRKGSDRRRELVGLEFSEGRHGIVLAVAPDPRRGERLLDERLRAEQGDERIVRTRGGVAVADLDRINTLHAVRGVPREDVAQSGILAHRAKGRQPRGFPRDGIHERIPRVVRRVQIIESFRERGGLDRSIELRERRVDHEAASAHRASQSFRVARIELGRTGLRTLQARRGALREFPVHVGEDDLGDIIARAKVLSHHGTDRSAPDQENTRWVGGYAVEPRFQ